MGFRPLHDRVLVRRIEAAEKTAGGIIIPETAKEKPQEGEIVSVGTGGDDFAFLRLFLGRVGNDNAAGRLFFGLHAANEHTIVQRTETHARYPFLVCKP